MTLQNICLSAIVENFERYYMAFSTTEDADLKRKFEFLQRVYSFEIAELLYEEYEMTEKYTDLVINKYLKTLDTNWLNCCPWKTVVSKMAKIGPNIKKIYFHECSEERRWQDIFCHLPNLEVMYFHRDCINEVLKSVTKFCPNIIEMDLKSCFNVNEEGLRHLYKKKNGKVSCPKLKNLFINSCDVTEAVAKCLIKNLPSLEIFDYDGLPFVLYSMHKQDLSQLDKVQPYNLNKLDLTVSHYPFYNDVLKVCFTVCPFLKSLMFFVYEPQQLDLLSGLSQLESLYLDNKQPDMLLDADNVLKSKGSKLISLTVCKCSLSDLTLAESCPSLKLLALHNVSLNNHMGSVPFFHNLDSFTVEMTELCTNESNLKSVCLILSSSPKLETITFKRCNLSSSEVKAEILKCCEHCPINKIDFSYSTTDKQFVIDILLTCHSLKTFNLDGCDFNTDDEEEIYKCAMILPNIPEVYFTEQLSISDYDDFFDDYYDNDDDYNDDYDSYDDYLHDYDEDDDDPVYGFFY